METMIRSKVTLLFMMFGILLAIPAIAFAQDLTESTSPAPTIQSDLPDYAPGDTATLTGSNWQPGESVHINVNDDQTQAWSRDVDVTADASGNITDQFQLPTTFAALYNVTATGAHSGVATANFTDGNVTVRARAGSTPLAVSFPANSSVKRYDNKTCTDSSAQSNVREFTTNGSNNAIYTSSGVTADYTQSVSLTAPSSVTISGTTYPFSGWTADSPSELQVVSSTETTSCITRGPSSSTDPVWNFTANYTDTTAPQVVSINRSTFSPTNDSQVSWRVTYSENVTGVNTADFSLVNTNPEGTPAITSVSSSGAISVVFASTGSGDRNLGLYLVDDDTIVDGAGNKLGGTGTGTAGGGETGNGSFTGQEYKIDRTAPTVDAVVPTENADNVDIGTNVSATFSEDMGTSVVFSGPTFTLKLPNGNTVLASRTHNAATNTATLNPTSNLANNTTYTATITTTARDLAGNPLATAKTWSFTTAPACTAPSVTTQPAPQSITYGANASFTAAANGTSPTVKWQKSTDGTTWSDISGATSTTLTLTKPSVSDSNSKYRAVFTNACGSATSNGNATLQVAQKNLTISGAVANDKPYDGNTNATVNFSGASLDGVVASGDMVTINSSGYSANFDNKNVGNDKAVTVTGVTLGGADAGNYSVSQPSELTANITPKALTGSFTAENKEYDGNTSATVDTTSLPGVRSGDTVNLDVTNAQFDNKNVADGKDVTGSLSLTGTDVGNYTVNASHITQADITAKELTGSFTAENKTYDGNIDATITGRSVAGKVGSDDVSLDGGTAKFDNKNVGQDKPVTLTGASLAGADKDNYNLGSVSEAHADITARDLTVSATGQSKVYDDNTSATVTFSTNKVNGDDVTASHDSASFDDKNVGTGKQVSVSGISISGADAGNYNLTNTSAQTTSNITAKQVTGSFTAADKVYDGNNSASITGRSLNGVLGSDDVSLSGGTATFNNADVGQNKTVTGTDFTLAGADKDNYSLASSTLTTTASILSWNAEGRGFYQPVGVDNSVFVAAPGILPSPNATTTWNTAKGGSTVPLKFNVFAESVEKTSTSDIKSFTQQQLNNCVAGDGDEPVEITTTGGTSLRYDLTDKQFIQNWKTPTVSNESCYRASVTFADGSSLSAFLKLRK